MNSSGVSKEVELHSFMGNFSGSFALSVTILAVWSLKSFLPLEGLFFL